MKNATDFAGVRLGVMILATLLLSVSIPVSARGLEGLFGQVLDGASGLPLEGATVTVTNAGGGVVWTGATDQFGQYDTSRRVAPGNYAVTFTLKGYLTRQFPATVRAGEGTYHAVHLSPQKAWRHDEPLPGFLLEVSDIAGRTPVVSGSNSLYPPMDLEIDNAYFAAIDRAIPLSSLNARNLPGELRARDAGLVPLFADSQAIDLPPGSLIRQVVPHPAAVGQPLLLTFTARSPEDGKSVKIYIQRGSVYDISFEVAAQNVARISLALAGDQRAMLGKAANDGGPSGAEISYDPATDLTSIAFEVLQQTADEVCVGFSLDGDSHSRLRGVSVSFKSWLVSNKTQAGAARG